MNTRLREVALALLKASWKDKGYNYDNLTEDEQGLLTKDEFNTMVGLMFTPKKAVRSKKEAATA